MSSNEYTKKVIIFAFTSGILIFLIFIVSLMLIRSINENRVLENQKELEVYAMVSEIGSNYIRVKEIDKDTILTIKTNPDYQVGDFLLITYDEDESKEIKPNTIETIAHAFELTPTKTTTSVITTKTSKTTTKTTSKNNKTTSKTTTTTTNKQSTTKPTTSVTKDNKEDVVLAYVEEGVNDVAAYNDTDSFKEKAKNTFITIVDFIFYDGEIKGVTWDELSSKAKAKVVYYTLLLDNKIDEKWPNYKENIAGKYNDIKNKLIAKYMDITTDICENRAKECNQTKEDFKLLKTSLNLTWDIIKSAFKYGYEKSTTYLKTWYETFSGK